MSGLEVAALLRDEEVVRLAGIDHVVAVGVVVELKRMRIDDEEAIVVVLHHRAHALLFLQQGLCPLAKAGEIGIELVRFHLDQRAPPHRPFRVMLLRDRLQHVGKISAEDAISLGWTGPCLRACGVPYDVRKAHPYGRYAHWWEKMPKGAEVRMLGR